MKEILLIGRIFQKNELNSFSRSKIDLMHNGIEIAMHIVTIEPIPIERACSNRIIGYRICQLALPTSAY